MIALALAAAQDAGYPQEAGPRKVATVKEVVLKDEKRGKELQLRVNHPDGDGPFPVVVFSHGAYGTKDNYQPLTEFWASHGYVTIQANHSDSRALGTQVGDPRALQDWQSRPADVAFILDSLEDLARKAPGLKGKPDRERIGIAGHSFGANTAQLVGGARAYPQAGGPGVRQAGGVREAVSQAGAKVGQRAAPASTLWGCCRSSPCSCCRSPVWRCRFTRRGRWAAPGAKAATW